jgi:hypothetical protein
MCDMWVQALAALPRAPSTWDDGVDGALLCHLLVAERDRHVSHCRMPDLHTIVKSSYPLSNVTRKYEVRTLILELMSISNVSVRE